MSHSRSFSVSLPHARGGVSVLPLHQRLFRSLPHARGGVSWPFASARLPISVFPTHVGVFLSPIPSVRLVYRLPHARGGVSVVDRRRGALASSSPRTWGCFHLRDVVDKRVGVFPTHVGVFPFAGASHLRQKGLPHARGGVSSLSVIRLTHEQVFPTHVGVFPILSLATGLAECLPHARGGVSTERVQRSSLQTSSPRTWGCFHQRRA